MVWVSVNTYFVNINTELRLNTNYPRMDWRIVLVVSFLSFFFERNILHYIVSECVRLVNSACMRVKTDSSTIKFTSGK